MLAVGLSAVIVLREVRVYLLMTYHRYLPITGAVVPAPISVGVARERGVRVGVGVEVDVGGIVRRGVPKEPHITGPNVQSAQEFGVNLNAVDAVVGL